MTTPDLPFQCTAFTPAASSSLDDTVDRWSNSNIEHPALVVIPNSEDDVIEAIRYAKQHGLHVATGGGGHGPFLPVDKTTLYLRMKNFNQIELDGTAGTVRIGGGVVSGQMLKALSEKGYYTMVPNSNAIGMAGFVLGGGNHPHVGFHGAALDNVISFRFITAAGKAFDLSSTSQGENLDLFHALCGAGFGFGVVTSLTMKVFPLSTLGMHKDNEFWTRKLIFPAPAVDTAIETFCKISSSKVDHALALGLIFARAPPSAPRPGVPVILLAANYFGLAADADKATKPTFDAEVVGKTVMSDTTTIPFAKLNDPYEPSNAHGDFKDVASAFVTRPSEEAVKAAYDEWLDFTTNNPGTQRTTLLVGTYDSEASEKIGQTAEAKGKFCEIRDRNVFMLAVSWYTKAETNDAAVEFLKGAKAAIRQGQTQVPRTFPNNYGPTTTREELFSDDKLKRLRDLKEKWDAGGLFWSPW